MSDVAKDANEAFGRIWEAAYKGAKLVPEDRRPRICIPRQPDDDDEIVDRALAALRYATQFALGRDGDDDRRSFVSVARQYGERPGSTVPPWTVCVAHYDKGPDHETERTFPTQAEALTHGMKLLRELRAEPRKEGA